jgi:hypothetical protein
VLVHVDDVFDEATERGAAQLPVVLAELLEP